MLLVLHTPNSKSKTLSHEHCVLHRSHRSIFSLVISFIRKPLLWITQPHKVNFPKLLLDAVSVKCRGIVRTIPMRTVTKTMYSDHFFENKSTGRSLFLSLRITDNLHRHPMRPLYFRIGICHHPKCSRSNVRTGSSGHSLSC